MSWDREKVTAALVELLGPATGVKVHQYPPKVLNPPCVVVSDPTTVSLGTGSYGIDVAQLPLVLVGGMENTTAVEDLKTSVRSAIGPTTDLGGVVHECHPTEERNWRNYTGAGGIQLLLCEFVLEVRM